MRTALKTSLVLLLALVPTILVLRNAELHAPVQDGTPGEFWWVVCGVDATGGGEFLVRGDMYPPKEESAIYYLQGYHGQFIRRVPLADVAPYLPKAIELLKEQEELHPILQQVLRELTESQQTDVRGFLASMWKARLEFAQKEGADQYEYVLESERGFNEQWRRAKYYWLTLAFESLWLGGIVVFAGLPWILNWNRAAWALQFGLIPTLLFLPYFLGYVPYTFTSAFPAGGVYYPYVLRHFRVLPWTRIDAWVMQYAPPLFEPLNQLPGAMLSVTGMGGVGPTATIVLGLIIGLLVFGIGSISNRLLNRYRLKREPA